VTAARTEEVLPSMPIPFPSEAWIQALKDKLNESDAYREAARTWEGDFYFIIKDPSGPADTVFYMDLWHGACRAAGTVTDPAARTPEFVIEAPLATWQKVLSRKLDPIQGLLTRQLILKGQLLKVMRVPRAATELVRCCTQVGAD
jgi:putative sterol carrier protein